MLRSTLGLAVVACLLPLVGADTQVAGGYMAGQDVPNSPQLFCEIVQTSAHSSSSTYACDTTGYAVGVTILRARIQGVGHVNAWADYDSTSQTAFVDCRATADGPSFPSVVALHPDHTPYYKMCSGPANVASPATPLSKTFTLRARVDGPGNAVYSVWLERQTVSLP